MTFPVASQRLNSKFPTSNICDLFYLEDAAWPLPGSVEAFSLPSVGVTLLGPKGKRVDRREGALHKINDKQNGMQMLLLIFLVKVE